jgi:phosphatidylinositol glycan class W
MSALSAHAALKQLKEAHVSNNSGSGWLEVLLVTCVPCVIGLDVFHQLEKMLRASPSTSLRVLLECATIVLPMVLCQCSRVLTEDAQHFVNGLSLVAAIYASSRCIFRLQSRPADNSGSLYDSTSLVNNFRSIVSIMTFIAILAVDFQVFPRRYCKTEVSGYGLMDCGTAAFVVAQGVSSRYARGKNSVGQSVWRKLLPLVLLGAVRTLTTKSLDYQEHATEYGTHWNFFYTLAGVHFFAIVCAHPKAPRAFCAVCVHALSAAYFVSLDHGLNEFIIHSSRTPQDSLFDQNREGILGVLPYASLFLVAEEVAKNCLWAGRGRSDVVRRLATFLVGFALATALAGTMEVGGGAVSRRTTNLTYVLWSMTANLALLTGLVCVTQENGGGAVVMHAVNRNGLVVFVAANLLTGLVNLSINTLAVESFWVEVAIVSAYIFVVVVVVAVGMDKGGDITLHYNPKKL